MILQLWSQDADCRYCYTQQCHLSTLIKLCVPLATQQQQIVVEGASSFAHTVGGQQCKWCLQDEHSDEYGPPIIPETAVAEAIMKRTQEHLRQLGNVSVSGKPIVMRAE
jgi:hypothetical protein